MSTTSNRALGILAAIAILIGLVIAYTCQPAYTQTTKTKVATKQLLTQLVTQYNTIGEQIKVWEQQKLRIEGQVAFLQGVETDSLMVPSDWVTPPPAAQPEK